MRKSMLVSLIRSSKPRQPVLSGEIRGHHGKISRQEQHSWPIRRGCVGRVLQEQGFAQPFGNVRGKLGEEACLGRSIRWSSSFSVQTQRSPTGSIGDKRGAHLIVHGQWRQDIPVALAAL